MVGQVDFLGILFIVWGLLTTLVGVSTLALGVSAFALISSAARGGHVAAGVTAAIFATLAFIAIAWGVAHIIVGIPLRRCKPWARMMALMLGSVDLLLLPYGTALGYPNRAIYQEKLAGGCGRIAFAGDYMMSIDGVDASESGREAAQAVRRRATKQKGH